MPLLNYTTQVPASRSISEIVSMLQSGGACAILLENDADRNVCAVSFKMKTTFGETAFQLPANVPAVILSLNQQIKAEGQRKNGYRRRIPTSLYNNKAQAERIAWRIVKDWLEAQLAIDQIGSAKLEQVLIPFAVDESGQTFYSRLIQRGHLLLK